MAISMADALKAEIMKPCSCNREKAIFYCDDETCISHNEQPFYCLFCFEERKLHPKHFPVRISKEVGDWETKWLKLKEELTTLQTLAT